ncbi:MAG: hypothetical protein ACYCYP_03825 [Leptospirales bacterium]
MPILLAVFKVGSTSSFFRSSASGSENSKSMFMIVSMGADLHYEIHQTPTLTIVSNGIKMVFRERNLLTEVVVLNLVLSPMADGIKFLWIFPEIVPSGTNPRNKEALNKNYLSREIN